MVVGLEVFIMFELVLFRMSYMPHHKILVRAKLRHPGGNSERGSAHISQKNLLCMICVPFDSCQNMVLFFPSPC